MQGSGLIQVPAALCLGTVSPVHIYMTGLASLPIWKNSENRTFLYLVVTFPASFSPFGHSVQLAWSNELLCLMEYALFLVTVLSRYFYA